MKRYPTSKILIDHPRTPYKIKGVKLGERDLCCAVSLRGAGHKVLHIPTGVTLATLHFVKDCDVFVYNFELGLTDINSRVILDKISWERSCLFQRNGYARDSEYTELYRLLTTYTVGLNTIAPTGSDNKFKFPPEFI